MRKVHVITAGSCNVTRMDKLDDQRLSLWQRASFVAGDTPRSVVDSLRLRLNLLEYEILDKSRLVLSVEYILCLVEVNERLYADVHD